jgi:hypothetical protein
MKKIKKLIWSVLNRFKIGGPIQLLLNGALIEDGWYKSFHSKRSIDRNGQPIPWCTYSFIKFIGPRLKKNFDAFEFGCGNSTLWYSQRIRSIRSVEHNISWFNKMKGKMSVNALLIYKELVENGDYSKEVLSETKNYHLIIIDGEDRNNCVKNSINKLREDGVIVFDNTQVPDYASSIEFLRANGFREIPFTGLLPIVNYNNTTSIFYRSNNCLEI